MKNIIFKYQFAFQEKLSTTLALIETIDSIRCLLDQGNYVLGTFIDLTKAFDTVDHEILLHKLSIYGIRGHANLFLRSYLCGRSQYTIVNKKESEVNNINYGVPQGSVLGPIFFLIYINDIYLAVNENNIRLFADDTALFTSNKIFNDLIKESKEQFQKLYQWCLSNKLTINIKKTCLSYFIQKK